MPAIQVIKLKNDMDNTFVKYPTITKENIEEVLLRMKQDGCSMLSSVKAVRHDLQISLKEADGLVLDSLAWENEKESIQKFRESFFESVEKLFEKEGC